jgi:hypothetical protein
VFFLHDKSEVASIFKKFAKKAQNEFDCKIKKIRSDNGKEFDNTNIHEYCDERLGSNMKYQQHIHLNKMELLKGKTEP